MEEKPNGDRWLLFSIDTSEDVAAARFVERFGRAPDEIREYKNLLWLGPIEPQKLERLS